VRAEPAIGLRASPNVSAAYGPPKTLYNRWKRWSWMGVFATITTELTAQAQDTEMVMIDVEPVIRHWSENHWRGHAKTHRTASSFAVKKGGADGSSVGRNTSARSNAPRVSGLLCICDLVHAS
jgi:hypothetical protein